MRFDSTYVFGEREVNFYAETNTRSARNEYSHVCCALHILWSAAVGRRQPLSMKTSRKKKIYRFVSNVVSFYAQIVRDICDFFFFVCAIWYWPYLTQNVMYVYLHVVRSSKYLDLHRTFIYLFYLFAQFAPLSYSFARSQRTLCDLRAVNACKTLFIT